MRKTVILSLAVLAVSVWGDSAVASPPPPPPPPAAAALTGDEKAMVILERQFGLSHDQAVSAVEKIGKVIGCKKPVAAVETEPEVKRAKPKQDQPKMNVEDSPLFKRRAAEKLAQEEADRAAGRD